MEGVEGGGVVLVAVGEGVEGGGAGRLKGRLLGRLGEEVCSKKGKVLVFCLHFLVLCLSVVLLTSGTVNCFVIKG